MSWIDHAFPRTATPSGLVGRVLGVNPGMMTGPRTNTHLLGRRDPVLLDPRAGARARHPPPPPPRPRGRRRPAPRALQGAPRREDGPRGLGAPRADGGSPRRTEGGRRRRHADPRVHAVPRLRPPLLLPGRGESGLHGGCHPRRLDDGDPLPRPPPRRLHELAPAPPAARRAPHLPGARPR